jgi:hypothetical protein
MSAYGSQAPPVAGYYGQQPPQTAGYYGQQPPQTASYYGQQPPQTASYYSQQPPQAAPSYSYQQENKPQQYGQSNSIDDSKINQNPKYNDIWAAVLFILCLISFAVLAYFGINDIKDLLNRPASSTSTTTSTSQFPQIAKVLGMSAAVALGSGFMITVAYFFLMQRYNY